MRRRLVTAVAAGLVAGAFASPAQAQLNPYETAECFAFWKLKEKLDRDGVGEIVAAGPKGPDGGLPEARMERVTLYLDLEEKLRFRCPDFAPPPDRSPERQAPLETAAPEGAATPDGVAQGDAEDTREPDPAAAASRIPMPARRPERR